MRKVDRSAIAVTKPRTASESRDHASLQLVCLGLMLALITLASRIYCAW